MKSSHWKNYFDKLSGKERSEAKAALDDVEPQGEAPVEAEASVEPKVPSPEDARFAALEAKFAELASENEKLQGLIASKKEDEQKIQADAIANAGISWADGLVAANKILPAQKDAFAATHSKLAAICAEAVKFGAEEDVTVAVASSDPANPEGTEQKSLLAVFAEAVEGKGAHGWTQEFARSTSKVQANRWTSESHNNAGNGETKLFSDEDIKEMAKVAAGKQP